MSFDLYLYFEPCTKCGRARETIWVGNVTHNVNPMVEEVFKGAGHDGIVAAQSDSGYAERSWGRLHGHVASDVRVALGDMQAWFEANKKQLVPLNPENGWGSTDCVRRVLGDLIAAIDDGGSGARIRASG